MRKFCGISVSSGIGIGPVFMLQDAADFIIPTYAIRAEEIDKHWRRFEKAVADVKKELTALRQKSDGEESAIFETHLLMLSDPDFLGLLKMRLEQDLKNIESVVFELSREFSDRLKLSDDPYLKDRASDIEDSYGRVINRLTEKTPLASAIPRGCVVCARSVKPSDIVMFRESNAAALILETGGATSHAAILAKSYRIPAVMGIPLITEELASGDTVIVDAKEALVYAEPDKDLLDAYQKEQKKATNAARSRVYALLSPTKTKDGCECSVFANISLPEEADLAFKNGADGIGLFRTEFLFLNNKDSLASAVSEENQFAAYKEVLSAAKKRPVVMRTMDVGGDKELAVHSSVSEKNPLMGWRAIRFCLDENETFKTQLRALYRAGQDSNMKIMFPMITSVQEFKAARAIAEQTYAELNPRNPQKNQIPIGAMIETPAAAVTADLLAKECAFFSIGTNDLIQYSLAIDRENEKVANLYKPTHPAILRLIQATVQAAKNAQIPVSICGEAASVPETIFLLLGLGVRQFSMSAASIPSAKDLIRRATLSAAKETASTLLQMDDPDDIAGYLSEQVKSFGVRP